MIGDSSGEGGKAISEKDGDGTKKIVWRGMGKKEPVALVVWSAPSGVALVKSSAQVGRRVILA